MFSFSVSSLYPPGSGTRLNQALVAGGSLGSRIWNKPLSHFDLSSAICPQKAAPAQGYIADSAISFKSLRVRGFVGLNSCSWTMTQTWRNDTYVDLEAIYTFPLAPGAILSGLSANIFGRDARGRVVAAREAEEAYENSISAGNLAIMVQKSSLGLATVHLGVLTPGDRLRVTLSCAKLTPWIENRVRFVLPLVISNRFGSEKGNKNSREKLVMDPRAEYAASLSFVVSPEFGEAGVETSDNDAQITPGNNGMTVSATTPMNRDFIMTIDAPAAKRRPIYIPAKNKYFLLKRSMADSAPSRPASVVVLLDCSGSMHGSRIALARKSLLHFAALLKPEEKFHLIRFGSIFEHIGGGLRFASPFNILRLRKSLKSAYAELGATRLDEALTDAIDRVPEGERADILLVSDGNVWNADDSIQKARERGIRIFCAAIGDAPNLSLLEKLARETGGKSLAVASAKEAAAIPRILVARMRVANDRAPFERGCPRNPRLSTPAHDCEFVFGRLESPSLDACEEIVREDFETWRPSLDPDLDKIAASAALGAMSDERDRLDLALEYQILNEETALILELGKRRSGEKLPRIEYVPQMLPRDQKAHKIVVEKSFAVPPLFGALADNFVEIQREDSQPQPEIYDKPSLREFIDYWMESISVHPPLEIQEIPEKFAIIRGFLKGLLDKYDIDERSLIIAFAKWLAEKYGLAAAIPRRAGRLFFSMRIDDDSLARLVEEFNLCSLDE